MNNLIKTIEQAGIVGFGGAGFPTHLKLNAQYKNIIINAAECEPLLEVDKKLLSHKADTLYFAITQLLQNTPAEKVIIGIKKKNTEYIKPLKNLIKKIDNIEISFLDDTYPAGDEHILVYEILGIVITEGSIPLKLGVVVINVETLYNIARAIEGEKVTDTYLSVVGEVENPKTMRVPIGTSILNVIKLCKVKNPEKVQVIEGGVMMGTLRNDLSYPVTKTTKGLIVLPENHRVINRYKATNNNIQKEANAVCCHCRMCTDTCPRYLLGHSIEPHKIMRTLFRGTPIDNPTYRNAMYCCECGICELIACPLFLSPRRINIMIKQQLQQAGIKFKTEKTSFKPKKTRPFSRIPTTRIEHRLELDRYRKITDFTENDIHPGSVKIFLKQHFGVPSIPVVKEGDKVKKGNLIARIPEGKLGANIHASIDGKVTKIDDDYMTLSAFK